MSHTPGLVIAGTHSGCGKTTVAMGLMAAFCKKGVAVQPFKVGPDYIDPQFHTHITGRASRNLDGWMLSPEMQRLLYERQANKADLCIVEGVMGFFDGLGSNDLQASTADLARILGLPVVLVVDAHGASLSLAATINGFRDFSPNVTIAGVILNHVHPGKHSEWMRDIVETHTGLPMLGFLPDDAAYSLSDRHLGLVPADDVEGLDARVNRLAERIAETVDLERIWHLASAGTRAPAVPRAVLPEFPVHAEEWPVLAVSRDRAFNFHYADNLDLLEMAGLTLRFFSPLEDEALPADVDGLWLSGGYPEVHARALSENRGMLESIRSAIKDGMPTYAECGGFMALTEAISPEPEVSWPMVGALQGTASMTRQLQRFGYVAVETVKDTLWGPSGLIFRAHEFHYSQIELQDAEGQSPVYRVSRRRVHGQTDVWSCGYGGGQHLLAAYPHIHLWQNPSMAQSFAAHCRRYRVEKENRETASGQGRRGNA